MGFRTIRGVPHYKVHWQGYSRDQDTWEPATNLASCADLISEYNSRKEVASPQKKVREGVGHVSKFWSYVAYVSTSQDSCVGINCYAHRNIHHHRYTPKGCSRISIVIFPFRRGTPHVVRQLSGSPWQISRQEGQMRSHLCCVAASEHGRRPDTF